MFELRIYNPINQQLEPVFCLTEPDETEAAKQARDFLLSQGEKHCELTKPGDERGKIIFGYQDEDSAAADTGGFGFLPNSPIHFVFKHIMECLNPKIDSFIDLGCGPGNILISAKNLLGAERLIGVEIDEGLVERARENTRAFGAEIIQANLLEWVPQVNDYDVVYMYEPMKDETIRQQFFTHLQTWLTEGQYVYYECAVGNVPEWLKPVDLPPLVHHCLYTFDKNNR